MALKGVAVPVPQWAAIMSMAGGDPLKAQEIEKDLSERWYEYGKLWAELNASVKLWAELNASVREELRAK
jgi:hypothetical protein